MYHAIAVGILVSASRYCTIVVVSASPAFQVASNLIVKRLNKSDRTSVY